MFYLEELDKKQHKEGLGLTPRSEEEGANVETSLSVPPQLDDKKAQTMPCHDLSFHFFCPGNNFMYSHVPIDHVFKVVLSSLDHIATR